MDNQFRIKGQKSYQFTDFRWIFYEREEDNSASFSVLSLKLTEVLKHQEKMPVCDSGGQKLQCHESFEQLLSCPSLIVHVSGVLGFVLNTVSDKMK